MADMSISSLLIQTCMTNIQKELSHLQHWLTSLPQGQEESSVHQLLEKLSKQYEVQQHALNHIVDRLDMLEDAREIHVEESPWLDESPMENTVVSPFDYTIHKSSAEQDMTAPSVLPSVAPSAIPSVAPSAIPSVVPSVAPVVPSAVPSVTPVVPSAVPSAVPLVAPSDVPSNKEEHHQEEYLTVPHVVAAILQSTPVEEESEEDNGVELEELTYKGITYYKDSSEGFIYGMDEDGQPTEQPIGIWKEKSKSISFYRA